MENEERQFKLELNAEEQHLESLLSEAFPVRAREGLSDSIMSSSHEQLLRASSTVLEKQLDNALAVAPPKNLSDRIFLTSIQDLKDEHPTVIARIGYATKWRELALAACILFAVLIATLVSTQSSEVVPSRDLLATNTVLSVEEEELLLEDLNLSEYSYLADTREIAFADVAVGFDGLRDDIELWQYGLLSE